MSANSRLHCVIEMTTPDGLVFSLLPTCPGSFLERGKSGESGANQGAPVFDVALRVEGDRGKVPRSPPASLGESAPLYPRAGDISDRSAKTRPPAQPETATQELQKTRSALAEVARHLARIDAQLEPVRDEEREIRASIAETHHTSEDGRIVRINLSERTARSPMFARLDEIAAKWGPLKAERTRTHQHVRSLERHAEHLSALIERKRRKESA